MEPTQPLPPEWDDWLALLAAQVPRPVRQDQPDPRTVVFLAGEPREVVVRLRPTDITVFTWVVSGDAGGAWTGAPARVGQVTWPRLPDTVAIPIVEQLIAAARAIRRATYRTCVVCGRSRAPEHVADDDVCRWCVAAS